MNIIQALVLGTVQGISEFFPISSSAHLVIADRIMQANSDLLFYLLLHLGTLISITLFFRKEIFDYFIDRKNKFFISNNGILVITASVPVFIVGYFFHDWIKEMFNSLFLIGIALIINSAVLFATRFFNGNKELNFRSSLIVGIMQMFSIFPGISRSGMVISGGIFSGLKKESLIMFSMMTSLFVIAGAFFYELIDSIMSLSLNFTIPMFFGFIASIIVGYLSLWLLIRKIKKGIFYGYWLYCFILGIILLFN